MNPANIPNKTTVISAPAIKANGIEIPIISSPAQGILPISPRMNMNITGTMIMPMGVKGARKKLVNLCVLNRRASVKPGFSPRAN